MAIGSDKKDKRTTPDLPGSWVFKSSLEDAFAHMDKTLEAVQENTAKTRARQPKRRSAA